MRKLILITLMCLFFTIGCSRPSIFDCPKCGNKWENYPVFYELTDNLYFRCGFCNYEWNE